MKTKRPRKQQNVNKSHIHPFEMHKLMVVGTLYSVTVVAIASTSNDSQCKQHKHTHTHIDFLHCLLALYPVQYSIQPVVVQRPH